MLDWSDISQNKEEEELEGKEKDKTVSNKIATNLLRSFIEWPELDSNLINTKNYWK